MTEELMYWSIEYRTRSNGRWYSLNFRHHLDIESCLQEWKLWRGAPPKYVRFRNTKTGEVVVP